MANSELNLGKLFQSVSKVLLDNKSTLNEADTYNHDHGSHMVDIFKLASKAANHKKDASPAQQLEYVGKQLQSNMKSGSAKLYADGFSRAAQQFQNQKQIQSDDILKLVQSLMGAGQGAQQMPAQSSSSDILGSLLGTFSSGQSTQQTQSSSSDPLSALLGSLGGGLIDSPSSQQANSPAQAPDGIDMNDIMAAGMAFFQSRQRGDNTLEALLDALIAGSQMSSSPARTQSGKLVANALLQAISGMGK